jgi:hypothetical protein
MSTRPARWFALALVAFLLAQPIPFLAFGADANDACCCKNMSGSCCRRSHHHSSGPEISSRECCQQCHVAVRQSQAPAATVAISASGELAHTLLRPASNSGWIAIVRHDDALFERPPPSASLTVAAP